MDFIQKLHFLYFSFPEGSGFLSFILFPAEPSSGWNLVCEKENLIYHTVSIQILQEGSGKQPIIN